MPLTDFQSAEDLILLLRSQPGHLSMTTRHRIADILEGHRVLRPTAVSGGIKNTVVVVTNPADVPAILKALETPDVR
jgi:hypothetical protein